MICLLCNSIYQKQEKIIEMLCFKPQQNTVCSSCWQTFIPITVDHCPQCFKPHVRDRCQDCRYWLSQGITVEHQALFHYNETMKSYFSSYKFQGDYLLRKVFASSVKKQLKAYRGYTLVPIPLGAKRLQERQFNQVTAFLDEAKLAYQELLGKEDGLKQSSKKRQDRLNTGQCFYLTREQDLPPKICLIDDIYTTGATIALAKRLLLEKGVKKVVSFSLAR